jgi:hypothetical protein
MHSNKLRNFCRLDAYLQITGAVRMHSMENMEGFYFLVAMAAKAASHCLFTLIRPKFLNPYMLYDEGGGH